MARQDRPPARGPALAFFGSEILDFIAGSTGTYQYGCPLVLPFAASPRRMFGGALIEAAWLYLLRSLSSPRPRPSLLSFGVCSASCC